MITTDPLRKLPFAFPINNVITIGLLPATAFATF